MENTITKNDGRLLDLNRLNEAFLCDEYPSLGTIDIAVDVRLKGVNAQISVKGKTIYSNFIQISHIKIEDTTSNIGTKRMSKIVDYLQELFLQEEFLVEHEIEDGYLYGKHNFTEYPVSGRDEGVFIEKISSSELEIIVEDTIIPNSFGEKNELNRAIFYSKNHLYVCTDDKYEKERENKFKVDFKGALSSTYGIRYALDENLNLFERHTVNDPNNIRLFISYEYSTEAENVRTKYILQENYSGYHAGYTLREMIEKIKSANNVVPKEWESTSDSFSYPLKIDNAIIYSPRVYGEMIPEFPQNSWVRISSDDNRNPYKSNEGKFGKVESQEGSRLKISLEDEYPNELVTIDYRYVEFADNPFNKIDEDPLVAFKTIKSNGEILKGFGRLVEASPNVSKIKLIGDPDETLKYLRHEFQVYVDSLNKFKADFKEVIGEELDYVIVKNENIDTSLINELFERFISEPGYKNHTQYQAIRNVVRLSKVSESNSHYFSTLLYYLVAVGKITFDRLIQAFTHRVLHDSDRVYYQERVDFDEDEIEKWIVLMS